jgi:hypothetical protein
MQRATILHRMNRFNGTAVSGGILAVVVIIGAMLVALQGRADSVAQRPGVSSAATPKLQSRIFADERGYRASVAEYAGLGESYLPAAPATVRASSSQTTRGRIFADEIGYTPSVAEYAGLGEDYLPLAAMPPRATHRASIPRIFADEVLGGDSLIMTASALSPWSSDITPLAGPR